MIRFICIGLLALTACSTERGPSGPAALCAQTVKDYALYRDEGPAASYADLFTEDGRFTLGGVTTEGREALIARHVSANTAAQWRHNMTDIRIKVQEGAASGVSRFIVQTGPRGDSPGAVAREIIGDYIDVFTLGGGACKIKSRTVRVVFDTSE